MFTFVLLLLLVAGIALLGLAVSGYGSPDRSREAPPRLPGHDIQERLAQSERERERQRRRDDEG